MPEGRTVMVYGYNRTGKTTLARGLEGPVLLLDIDCAARHLVGAPGIKVIPFPWELSVEGKSKPYADRWRQFGAQLELSLLTDPARYKWLVIDSLTIFQLRLEEEVRRTQPDNRFDIFTRSAEAILEVYEGPFARLVNRGLSVLSLCHADDKKSPKRPSLNGNDFPPRLLNFHDKIGYLYLTSDHGAVSNHIGWLLTPEYLAGDRSQPAPDAMIPKL